jgi:hypothetical protein
MTEEELIKKLKILKTIEPDPQYARTMRYLVLSSKDDSNILPVVHRNIFSRSLNMVPSIVLITVFLLVLTLSIGRLSAPQFEGVNNESLVSEANTITDDIDIKLQEIKYFADAPDTLALAEEQNINNENKIDKLLEEVISY